MNLTQVYGFQAITLSKMTKVRLMKRVDTKYVTTREKLHRILQALSQDYYVQEIDGKQCMPYATLYYDTHDATMFQDHHRGKPNRQKIRIRTYCHNDVSFLEVKNKKGNGQTSKKRIEVDSPLYDITMASEFLSRHTTHNPVHLEPKIANQFSRITLVSKEMNERVTIDIDLTFRHCHSGVEHHLDDLVVIELKRNGHAPSKLRQVLNDLFIPKASFSKYCMAMVLCDKSLKHNLFKPRLHALSYRVSSIKQAYSYSE